MRNGLGSVAGLCLLKFVSIFPKLSSESVSSLSESDSPNKAFRGLKSGWEDLEGQTLAPCPGCLHLMQIIVSRCIAYCSKVEMLLAFLFGLDIEWSERNGNGLCLRNQKGGNRNDFSTFQQKKKTTLLFVENLREGSRSTAHLKTPQRGDCKRAAEKKSHNYFSTANCHKMRVTSSPPHIRSRLQAHLQLHVEVHMFTNMQKCMITIFGVRAVWV